MLEMSGPSLEVRERLKLGGNVYFVIYRWVLRTQTREVLTFVLEK